MRKPVRALYVILICTVLLVVGTEAGNESQRTSIGSDSDESLSLTYNEDMEIEYHPSLSRITKIHDYDTEQAMKYREQTDTHPYLCSTAYDSSTEYPLNYCIRDELAQKSTESNTLINCHQPTNPKRPEQAKKENTSRKKQKKKNESTASNLNTDSTDDVLDSSKLKQIKINISAWNNARLKNRHRESQHASYKSAVVTFDKFRHNKYRKIGDEIHHSLIEAYAKYCKSVNSKVLVHNEFWFAIASRTSCMHIKHADCKAMNTNPSEYKFIEELSGYYPGLPGDIVKYMDKHKPIVSDQESIKTEWKETLGDIHVRKPIKPEYTIDKETIIVEASVGYRPVATAVQMILALPEVHKDLFNLTIEFIEKTLEEETDSNHLTVVRVLHKIVEKHKSSNKSNIDEEYAVFYNLFTDILHQTCVSPDFIVIQLYTEMYKSLTYFYEKAEVCEGIQRSKRKNKNGEKEYYLLAGKCIIKPQRYLKCTTTIDLRKPMSEYVHEMKDVLEKWTIPSDIEKHYHIHYVDNTKQKYTRVCMPIYLGPIHTISQTIEYLKKIHSIEKEECICPYTRDQFGYWMYIQDEERDKTVNEFSEYDIVFYYIEEGPRENYFTFAEFESYLQPEGETVRIPLFLSPLMRSAVSMGPFEERDNEEHEVIDNMQYMWILPDVYTYNLKYKSMEYSFVYHYYSNLYIRRDNVDVPTIDCYIMDSKEFIRNNTATVQWYVKVPNSVDEYTHCLLSDELKNDQKKYNTFSKVVKTQEYTPDSEMYGFVLRSSVEKTSRLDGMRYNMSYSIDLNNIFNCKLSIVPMHKTSTDKMIADIQSKIDRLNRDIELINIMIKKPETTEEQKKEQKRKRKKINNSKSKNIQKLKQMQLPIKKDFGVTPFPSYAFFLVFRHSNTQTKSSLGAHNEILDIFSHRYNNPKSI